MNNAKEAAQLLIQHRLRQMSDSTHQGDALDGWAGSGSLATDGERLASKIQGYVAQMQTAVAAFYNAIGWNRQQRTGKAAVTEKIWLVGGTTGEDYNRIEWAVDAWRSEADAQTRVRFLTEKMRELGATGSTDYAELEKTEGKMREFDPGFRCDYTGASYYVYELELKAGG